MIDEIILNNKSKKELQIENKFNEIIKELKEINIDILELQQFKENYFDRIKVENLLKIQTYKTPLQEKEEKIKGLKELVITKNEVIQLQDELLEKICKKCKVYDECKHDPDRDINYKCFFETGSFKYLKNKKPSKRCIEWLKRYDLSKYAKELLIYFNEE